MAPNFGSIAVHSLISRAQELAACHQAALTALFKPYGITPAEWRLMEKLYRHRWSTVSDTARTLKVSRQATQRVVNSLENKGLVRVGQHPKDKRADAIGLDMRGRDVFEAAKTAHDEWLNELGGIAGVGIIEGNKAGEFLDSISSAIANLSGIDIVEPPADNFSS